MTAVLICDDRRSVREGLTRVMSAVPGVARIDCVAHGDELLARYSRQAVDVVLVGTQRAVPTGGRPLADWCQRTHRPTSSCSARRTTPAASLPRSPGVPGVIYAGTRRVLNSSRRWRIRWPARRCRLRGHRPTRVSSSPNASCKYYVG